MERKPTGVRNVTYGDNVTVYEPANLYDCTLGNDVFIGPFVEIGAIRALVTVARSSRTPSFASMSLSATAVLSVMG